MRPKAPYVLFAIGLFSVGLAITGIIENSLTGCKNVTPDKLITFLFGLILILGAALILAYFDWSKSLKVFGEVPLLNVSPGEYGIEQVWSYYPVTANGNRALPSSDYRMTIFVGREAVRLVELTEVVVDSTVDLSRGCLKLVVSGDGTKEIVHIREMPPVE